MSCISPIAVQNNSKRIYKNYRAKLINYVPCGKCYECRKQKTFDLMIRSYYDESDYVIFDTLSYSEKNVPWLKNEIMQELNNQYELKFQNVRIIKYEDYQKFMKRLRKNMKKNYKDVELKYICSAEYGHDDNYIDDYGKMRKGTNRPHFHLIIFVKGNILPVVLSKMIKQNWKLGKTDGVEDKGLLYFNCNRLFKDYLAKKNVVGYLCKYVTKTNSYQAKLNEILKKIENQIYNQIFGTDKLEEKKNDVKKILKKYNQFVRWSQGLGKEYLVDSSNIKQFMSKNYIQIRTDLKNKKYSLPLYYNRKLFKKYVKEYDEYQLTELGKEYELKKLNNILENNKKKLKLYTDLKDDVINEIAYYWTYIKDRNMKDGKDYIPDYKECYWSENSVKDRKVFPNGNILIDGKNIKFDEFIKKSVENCLEFDEIILKVNKKIKDEMLKVSEFKEKNEEIKKNLKKC